MVSLKLLVISTAILAIASVSSSSEIQPRISGGAVVDTLQRFPHHVTIRPNSNQNAICGGSIISKNWILTSASCVAKTDSLELQFQRLFRDNSAGSFAIVINSNASNVIVYPTGYDDIALVKIPVDLIQSDTLKAIPLSRSTIAQWQNKLAVIAGFNSNNNSAPSRSSGSDVLNYAMLNIVSNSVCSSAYHSGVFDEYLNICAQGWSNNRNVPCSTDLGSGLVGGWPRDSQLIGIYTSTSYDCDGNNPSVYVNVQKYITWIDSIVQNN